MSAILTMRPTIFTVTLSVLVTWSFEQQQQQQQQEKEQLKYHNLSIMLNAIDSDMPLSLQNSIAACCSIIREYFVPSTNSFMLSTNVQELYLKKHMKDFLNNVLLNLPIIKVEIESKSSEERKRSFNRKYNLIVVDSTESLRQLDPANFTRNYDIQEYYLVYVMHYSRFNDSWHVVQQMFAYFWQNTIINVSLVGANKNSIVEVYTYFPFDNYLTCKMPLVKQINAYDGAWSDTFDFDIFPEKIIDLKGCPLGIAIWNTPPYLSYLKNSEGLYEIDYFEAVLLNFVSKKLNFSLNLMEPPNNELRGKVFANGTITGALKMLHDHTADFSLGSFRYTLERSELLTAALPYYQTYQIYCVLRTSQLYTSLEVLVYPFDNITWIYLFLSIQIGLLLAFTIQYFYDQSILIRIAIGFPRIRTPLTNIVSIFLGQSIIQIPETNLARFMIIWWHIYGLLMRTIYQSLLFQLLKLNLYHEPPKTLDELIDHGCTLVMTEGTFDSVYTVPRIDQGLIEVIKLKNTSEQSSFFYIESDKRKRCQAAVSPKDFLTFHVIEERKRGIFYVLPENIFTQHITMYFSKHSYLINRFDELFMNLRSMGLIDFWAHQSLDAEFLQNVHESIFVPINIENLEGILLIYAVLISIALVLFFVEIACHKIKIKFFHFQHEFIP